MLSRMVAASTILVLAAAALCLAEGQSGSVEHVKFAVPEDFAGSGLYEDFGEGWQDRWTHSRDAKYTGWFVEDQPATWPHPAITIPAANQHYGLTAPLADPVIPAAGFVFQYVVRFAGGATCGGAYVKLLTATSGFQPDQLRGDTPYSIMFGPDQCGAPGKVHLILRHCHPVTGDVVEHHLRDPPTPPADRDTHMYTLQIKPDNTFQVWLDGVSARQGSLLDQLDPPLQPPQEIADPQDVKPTDWVDDAEMPGPDVTPPDDWDERTEVPDMKAVKPSGWLENEPALVDNSKATQPEQWDEEEDGKWAAPQVANPRCRRAPGCGPWQRPSRPNPAYKGDWVVPQVPNPDYKGPWVQRLVANPLFAEVSEPLSHLGLVGALALELWTNDEGYTFGGFLMTPHLALAHRYRDQVFAPIQDREERAARLAADAEKPNANLARHLSNAILAFFDRPALRLVKMLVRPFLGALDEFPNLVLVLMVLVMVLTMAIIGSLLRGAGGGAQAPRAAPPPAWGWHRVDDAVGRAKKVDASGADDNAAEDEDDGAGGDGGDGTAGVGGDDGVEREAGAAAPLTDGVDGAAPAEAEASREEAGEAAASEDEAPRPTRRRTPRA